MISSALIFLAVLAAASLEVFEAFVIVTTVGHEIGMRRAVAAAAVSTLILVGLTAAFGSLVLALPAVQIVTGTVLFLFGARWLVKSVLKMTGRMTSHGDDVPSTLTVWAGRIVAAKGTFMEGVEVVIIVGAMSGGHATPAIVGAIAAVVLVLAVGYSLRRVLTGVPKLWMKFVVGSMMCSFGCFFAGEGLGVAWPLGSGQLIVGALVFVAIGLVARRLLQRKPLGVNECAHCRQEIMTTLCGFDPRLGHVICMVCWWAAHPEDEAALEPAEVF